MSYTYTDTNTWATTLLSVQRIVQREFRDYMVYVTPFGGMRETSRIDLVDDKYNLIYSMTIPDDHRTIDTEPIIKAMRGELMVRGIIIH